MFSKKQAVLYQHLPCDPNAKCNEVGRFRGLMKRTVDKIRGMINSIRLQYRYFNYG